ncbi:MAG: hypothetical protein [Bacteriophage sp.]|nr:MAG: hypothetical protein [Bacteriophage sp.]UWI08439.1 MAG: hypothetical protein [Bacteriophage sp.]
MKKGEKMKKPPVYNYTPESLRGQLKWEANQEFQEKVKKIKAEVYDDAVNAAMMLLLTLPCQVLMEHFWQKSSSKNIPKFLDLVLDYYGRWQNGELDMGKLKKDLWEIGGIRMEEDVKGYKNQADIDKVTQEIQTVQKDLALTRVTAGDDMVALSVGLSVMEKGNKAIIEGLKALGFRQIRREKVTERCVKSEYQGYKYRVILEKDLQEAEE